jgi:hypothetical protein
VKWSEIADAAKSKDGQGRSLLSPVDLYMLSLVEKGAMKLPEEYVSLSDQAVDIKNSLLEPYSRQQHVYYHPQMAWLQGRNTLHLVEARTADPI